MFCNIVRTQIAVFKAQHQDVPPGYPCGDPTATPTADAFVEQMTQQSDVNCDLSVGFAGIPIRAIPGARCRSIR